jgi:5-methylcytosine-specific restriction endonuclease McrA
MQKLILDFWFQCIAAPLWRFKRRMVYRRDHGRCYYCAEAVTREKFTVDHVVPLARGGTDAASNLVTCCKYCNKIKADKPMSGELLIILRQRAAVRARHCRATT